MDPEFCDSVKKVEVKIFACLDEEREVLVVGGGGGSPRRHVYDSIRRFDLQSRSA